MPIIARNETARRAIENSEEACAGMNALLSFVETYTTLNRDNKSYTFQTGLAWLSSVQTTLNDTYYLYIGTLDGTVTNTFANYYNTYKPVNRFVENIGVSCSIPSSERKGSFVYVKYATLGG